MAGNDGVGWEVWLESTSEAARHAGTTLMFFLVGLCAYLAIATAGITHAMLLLRRPIPLPVLDVGLPIWGYALVVPVLVLALHAHLLMSVHLLRLKVRHLRREGELDRFPERGFLLFPSITVHHLLRGLHTPVFRSLLLSSFLVVLLAPWALVLFLEWKFLPMRSHVSVWHAVGVTADGFLLLLFAAGGRRRVRRWCWAILLLVPWTLLVFRDCFPLVVQDALLVAAAPPPEVTAALLAQGVEPREIEHRHSAGLDLRGRDLRGADLSGCRLYNADLRGARLDGARLVGVDLSGADLSPAGVVAWERHRLRGAARRRWIRGWLRGAAADGRRTRLVGADLSGAVLIGADLLMADLRRARLHHADLRGALLQRALLEAADLSAADLRAADLADADLDLARLPAARLEAADLSGAHLAGADLTAAQVRQANFASADLRLASFRRADARQVHLRHTRTTGADFSYACLHDARPVPSIRVVLRGAVAAGACFCEPCSGTERVSFVLSEADRLVLDASESCGPAGAGAASAPGSFRAPFPADPIPAEELLMAEAAERFAATAVSDLCRKPPPFERSSDRAQQVAATLVRGACGQGADAPPLEAVVEAALRVDPADPAAASELDRQILSYFSEHFGGSPGLRECGRYSELPLVARRGLEGRMALGVLTN